MKALVVISGGQDSTTCLVWALNMYKEVEAITFFYGQKHEVEVEQSKEICRKLKVKQKIVDLSFLPDLVDSALTSDGDVNQQHSRLKHLPASFVPNRNALFLTLAHAYAQKIGALRVVTGVCQVDSSGYPDTKEEFIRSLEKSLNLASDAKITILTPLMFLSKAQIWKLVDDFGFLDFVVENTHTCYNGGRVRHPWGYGCSVKISEDIWEECPACRLRRLGYLEYMSSKEKKNQ